MIVFGYSVVGTLLAPSSGTSTFPAHMHVKCVDILLI
jgi:hypothetical protein